MRYFIAGNRGQLGRALTQVLADEAIAGGDLPELDIANREQVEAIMKLHRPNVLINCAAYTNVDGCVKNPDLAYRANGHGPQTLAVVCKAYNCELVHISSNEVFPGTKSTGYNEWDTTQPINAYGQSKAAGEFNVRHILPEHYIVRLSWLFAPGGNNFVHKMIQLADKYGALRVVTDEISSPTWVYDLAHAIKQLIVTRQYGTYHLSNSGVCSRFDFAKEIMRLSGREHVPVRPILGSEFKRASTPPPACALNNNAAAALGITLRPWQEALADYIENHL